MTSDSDIHDTEPGAASESGEDGGFTFQAEVARLLQLMVHSVYSEREVFLRELISNGADACDKLRYRAITEPGLLGGGDPQLRITISGDPDKATLTVADNGVGMDRAEMIENLGTIARSGTRAFVEQLKAGEGAVSQIGQFGVGFYAAFMVADEVVVTSRKAGTDETTVWRSDGINGFHVADAPDAIERGTVVTLHLKDDAKEFLEESRLESVVRRYSDHVSFPIDLLVDRDGAQERRQLNSASALWSRPKSEITPEHYTEFYRDVAGQFDEPALTIHYTAEGRHEYTVLAFVPASKPFDLYDPERAGRVRLYVRRVYITDEAALLPAFLRFVRGVIDSQDMPLNISREMLQNNPIVAAIRKAVTSRVLSEIGKLAGSDPDKFIKLWEAFGPVIKEGLYEAPDRRDTLFEVARFRTTASDGWRSLKDYVADMKENQTAIYYLVGGSQEALKASPQLEGFRARGVEVLLLSDPVDNFWVTTALGFDGKGFQSVTQGDADLSAIPEPEKAGTDAPDAGEEAEVAPAEETARLTQALETVLSDAVSGVKVSKRLVASPACLVAPAGAPDLGLGRLLEQQAGQAGISPVLEINTRHPLVKRLSGEAEAAESVSFSDLAWLLLDQARILDGDAPSDPAKFTERMNRLLLGG